jgi:sterol desaturase/sphingolipid hydroxylase (fatty acid hydroxylase superfamily)
MGFLELEHSSAADRADLALYSLSVLGLGGALWAWAPLPVWQWMLIALLGYLLWGLLEYLLHRFVLHRVQPFRAMHEQHHMRPLARIGTPTMVSVPLFALFLFLPAWAMVGLWPACALTLGLLSGYLAYAAVHHACHHGRRRHAWARHQRRWHARHHHRSGPPGCYGVSHGAWDRLFGTVQPLSLPTAPAVGPALSSTAGVSP